MISEPIIQGIIYAIIICIWVDSVLNPSSALATEPSWAVLLGIKTQRIRHGTNTPPPPLSQKLPHKSSSGHGRGHLSTSSSVPPSFSIPLLACTPTCYSSVSAALCKSVLCFSSLAVFFTIMPITSAHPLPPHRITWPRLLCQVSVLWKCVRGLHIYRNCPANLRARRSVLLAENEQLLSKLCTGNSRVWQERGGLFHIWSRPRSVYQNGPSWPRHFNHWHFWGGSLFLLPGSQKIVYSKNLMSWNIDVIIS